MKFWQKTFIFTLALFLLCFGIGVFSIAVFFNGQLTENCENTCLAEQFYISRSFATDSEYTVATGGSMSDLVMSYYEYYNHEGMLLAIEYGGKQYSEASTDRLTRIAFDAECSAEGEDRTHFQKRVDGTRYIFIKNMYEGGSITYIKDISYLDDDWRAMVFIFVTIALAVAVVLASLLFFLLKRLSLPLVKLTESTDRVASGDYSVRASEKGGKEFAALAKGFNNMTKRISDQIAELELVAEQKQQLVDDLSHEMRTPLTSIHGYAEYLLGAAVNEEERIDALLCIMSEAERLGKLSSSLLDISYIGNSEPIFERVELEKIFVSVSKRFELVAKNMGAELSVNETDLCVKADSVLCELLVSNLTDNAIKACRNSDLKRVSVTAEKDGDSVVIKVTDSGRGMTEQEMLHITEPFYRTDKARSRADGGAGLGLSLCRKIVDAYGGELRFDSSVGSGTSVTVRLRSYS